LKQFEEDTLASTSGSPTNEEDTLASTSGPPTMEVDTLASTSGGLVLVEGNFNEDDMLAIMESDV